MELSEQAVRILESRYLLKDDKGAVVETPEKLFRRVAEAIAEAELAYDRRAEAATMAARFYSMMSSLSFLPNSPTLMNAGAPIGQLSACFVLPIDDNMDSIFMTVADLATIFKSGGGVGLSFSRLRPKGDLVKSTGGKSSGPVSFMRVFDSTADVVSQGGKRRGALMGTLRVDHPDILDFVRAKQDLSKLNCFNTSVAVTDRFMAAVERDEPSFGVVNPRDDKITTTYKAKEIWKEIVKCAWRTGEPGLVFIDRINAFHTEKLGLGNLGTIESTNPCGEQPLIPYESCNLGSINLANMVLQDGHGAFVDDASLITTVETAVRFLDNVIDVNKLPLPQISAATLRSRKIGLGVMGFAEMLIKLGVPYNSDEALAMAKRVSAMISEAAHKASKELAEERGPFPAGDGSPGCFRRNATLTTIAPTGTISMIAGVTGGIEPIFAVGLKHQNILDGATFTQVHPLFVQHAHKYEYWSQGLMEAIADGELLAGRTDVPSKARRLFETAHEISPEFHVKMQAAWQGNVDNAVSKTVNLPSSATKEDVEAIFRCAWDLGCKGVTVYRDGCREDQPMTTGKHHTQDVVDEPVGEGSSDADIAKVRDWIDKLKLGSVTIIEDGYIKPDDRPDVLPGKTYKMRTGCGTLFVTVSQGPQGRIVEMFAHHGKAGVCSQAQCEAIGRLTSLALRSHVDPMEVAKQLAGITCHVTHGFGKRKVLSCADGIGKVLLRLIKETSDDPNATNVKLEGLTIENPEPAIRPDRSGACPDCGAALIREANCTVCKVCGYERCT